MVSLLTTLKRYLKWLVPATHVSLCVQEPDGSHYRVFTASGDEARFSMGMGLAGWVLHRRTMLDVPDLQDAAYLPPELGGITLQQGEGAVLAVPLHGDDRFVGVLTLGSHRVGAFASVDRGVVRLIASQVAAAAQMVLLLEELDGATAIISGLARAVEAKDPYTHGHAGRVTDYAVALVDAAGLPGRVRELVAQAGPLHDVGKIGVPDAVLMKAGPLTDEEFALIMRHPAIGEEICKPLQSLRHLRAGIRHHHERYDGRGYPDGLGGMDIPIEARVLAVADAFDAMTSHRPYRQGMTIARACEILTANEGPQWDPDLVPLLCALVSRDPIREHP